MAKVAIFSFFSGAGFLDLGFEKNGYSLSFVNEYENDFLRIHKHSRKSMGLSEPKYGYSNISATKFLKKNNEAKLKSLIRESYMTHDLVGFIAGPPCPDFSIAGKNRGGEGPNGQLSSDYINIILNQRPDFFVFENVKGLWSTARHRAYYDSLIYALNSAGYSTVDKLVNAIEYGAPQSRERVILVGFKNSVFGSQYKDFDLGLYATYSSRQIKNFLWPKPEPFKENSVTTPPSGLPIELTAEYWFQKNEVYNHPNSLNYFSPKAIKRFTSTLEGDVKRKSFKRLHRWKYSPTCAYGNNEVHLHPYKSRRLSVAEALALQSLPKEFSYPQDLSLTAMFKATGNGVPFLLADGIARSLKTFFLDVSHEKPSLPSRNTIASVVS